MVLKKNENLGAKKDELNKSKLYDINGCKVNLSLNNVLNI
jgi:hypothetical protein